MVQAWTGVKLPLLFWWHWKVGFPKAHVASLLPPLPAQEWGEGTGKWWDGGELSIAPILARIRGGIYLVPSLLQRLRQCPVSTVNPSAGAGAGHTPCLSKMGVLGGLVWASGWGGR